MKIKNNINKIYSGDYLEQALFKGLNKQQKAWAKNEIKKFDSKANIPYGFIRKCALNLFTVNE